MELVSVIVPIYNCEITIRRCLESLLAQTYQNLEIILVNNGSHDKSGLIAKECAQSNLNVVYLQCDKLTKGNTCEVGLGKANGTYICFIDGKDYVDKDYISKMMEAFGDADYVEPRRIRINEYGKTSSHYKHTRDDINDYNLMDSPAYLADVSLHVLGNIYRRELIDDLKYIGDLDYATMILLKTKHLQVVSNTTYYVYNRDDEPIMYDAKEAFASMKRLKQYLVSNNYGNYYWLYEKIYICDFLEAMCFHHASSEKEKKERLVVLKEALLYLEQEKISYKLNNVLSKKDKTFIRRIKNPILKGFMLK